MDADALSRYLVDGPEEFDDEDFFAVHWFNRRAE